MLEGPDRLELSAREEKGTVAEGRESQEEQE
jgi:hypothetical protein